MIQELFTTVRMVRQRLELEMSFGVDFFFLPQNRKQGPSSPSGTVTPQNKKLTNTAVSETQEENKKKLIELAKKCSNCTKCPLSKTRTQVVFGEGDHQADLLILGEAPGYHEDIQGKPFVGAAGMLLTRILASIGLTRESIYICNVIKCRPPENRDPLAEEIACCTPWLKEQLALLSPKVICGMGRFAASWLTGSSQSITRIRGELYKWNNIPVICTFHPAYLLRNPDEKRKTWDDIQKVAKLLGLSSK